MRRVECIEAMSDLASAALVLTTAGGATSEWWNHGDNRGQLQVRTLGLGSSIGLGLAVSLPNRPVIVLDGDGALLMNLHTLVTCAAKSPPNLIHICFDNGAYESSGGTPTFTAGARIDLGALARAANIANVQQPADVGEFVAAVRDALDRRVHTFIHARVEQFRSKVPNIAVDEVENKYRFLRHIEQTEGTALVSGTIDGQASASLAEGTLGHVSAQDLDATVSVGYEAR